MPTRPKCGAKSMITIINNDTQPNLQRACDAQQEQQQIRKPSRDPLSKKQTRDWGGGRGGAGGVSMVVCRLAEWKFSVLLRFVPLYVRFIVKVVLFIRWPVHERSKSPFLHRENSSYNAQSSLRQMSVCLSLAKYYRHPLGMQLFRGKRHRQSNRVSDEEEWHYKKKWGEVKKETLTSNKSFFFRLSISFDLTGI